MMDNQQLRTLLEKYKTGGLTRDEKAILESWYISQAAGSRHEINEADLADNLEMIGKKLLLKYLPASKKLWPRVAAAASVLLFLTAGGYYFFQKHPGPDQATTYIKNDIPPGHNQATLTLANGKRIILTEGLTGKLVQQGNVQIRINSRHDVVYTASGVNHQLPVAYNTLSTAKGEQSPYPLILADGTKVWLNAMSSITFPTVFSGKDRTVKITGEAYFEVIHNSKMPFRVTFKGQTVEDIGTHFNINAYDDEPFTKTTLIEGAAGVTQNKENVILKAGQQAIVKPGNTGIVVKVADLESAIAWVGGKFRFNDENMQAVMRQLSRWYDVDVQYRGTITTDGLNGKISRYKNLGETLQMLESTKLVHFKTEGRRITVIN